MSRDSFFEVKGLYKSFRSVKVIRAKSIQIYHYSRKKIGGDINDFII